MRLISINEETKEMRSWEIFRLPGKRETEILGLIDSHLALIMKSVSTLKPLLAASVQGDWTAAEGLAKIIVGLESEAADVRRRITLDICAGAFFAGLRESFISLAEVEDKIADASNNSARILTENRPKPEVMRILLENPSGDLNGYLENITKTVEIYRHTIDCLKGNRREVLESALEVERWEKTTDESKMQLLRAINANKGSLDILTLLQLREFVLALDEIADAAEDASDVAIVIVAKVGT
jgi:predicted phosphate transport protein (TIGR00153 family)